MELGALVCTARTPRCDRCPVADQCRWRTAGYPAGDGRPRRSQGYEGTDRAARGALLAVMRQAPGPVSRAALETAVAGRVDPVQRERALASLVADRLVQPSSDGTFTLPD